MTQHFWRLLVDVWGPFLLLILGSGLLGYLFERFVISVLKRATHATRTQADDVIVRAVHPALVVAVFVGGVWFGVRYLGTGLPPAVIEWTNNVSLAVVLLLGALVLSRLIRGVLQQRALDKPRLQPLANLGGRAASVLLYFLAFLIVLDYYGLTITPLLTSLGIAGLAVALALQDTLSNFFSGVWMQIGQTLRPGHFIRLEEHNLEGYVVEVGWRTTKIRTLPNNIIVVPNAKLAQSVFTDYHQPDPRMSLLIPIAVGFEADPDRVEQILVEEALAAAGHTPGLLSDPKPFVRFIPGFGEYALQFTLICQVAEFVDQYIAQHEIRKRILKRFRKEGIRIPYPVRNMFQTPAVPAESRGLPAGQSSPPRPT